MRHAKGNRKLSRPTDQRLALLKSLVIGLFLSNRIETTVTRAKEARRLAEKLITLGKRGDLHSRRNALRILPNQEVISTVFSVYAKKFQTRNGGYTRIIQTGFRRGDAAPTALLELVD